MNLCQKLVEIRKGIDFLQKTETDTQGIKSIDPAILLYKIREGMNKHNVLLMPSLSNPDVKKIEDPTKNNPGATSFLFTGLMTYSFVNAEDPVDRIDFSWFCAGKNAQDPARAGGSALTYFEKYFLLKFFQIPTSKDDPDTFENKAMSTERITQEQVSELVSAIESRGYTGKAIEPILVKYAATIAKVTSIDQLPAAKFEDALTFFQNMTEKK